MQEAGILQEGIASAWRLQAVVINPGYKVTPLTILSSLNFGEALISVIL